MTTDLAEIYKRLDFLDGGVRVRYANILFSKCQNNDLLDNAIKRLQSSEPIEYVLNFAEFRGLELYVDIRVLIPRIETEEIPDRVIHFINTRIDKFGDFTIIDVGTGSGCILFSIAHELRNINLLKYVGVDISEDALEVAKLNTEKLEISEKIQLIKSDFREFDFSKYENVIITANLPYIPNSRVLQKSVADFEPHTALFGGENGDEMIVEFRKIIKKLKNIRFCLIEKDQGEIEEIML